MKLNHFALVNGTKDFGRRKKERDSVQIDAAIKAALDGLEHHAHGRDAFWSLMQCMRARTRWLKPTLTRGTPCWVAPVFLINRLKNLAIRRSHWIRPCETWGGSSGNLRPAFHSLAEHLLAHYPVPRFMDSAWDLPDGPEGFRLQSWFIRLGRGASFRSLNLPLPLSRRMEHYVRGALDHYSVLQALRYGEARGLGGSEKLAREVATGRLGQRIKRADFWRTVLMFLVAHPEMRLEDINPIIDFIHANKFARDEVLTAHGPETRNPQWPDFSIKGRSLKSLLRLVTAWHADLSSDKQGAWCSWKIRHSRLPLP
jgi:hypothetical protein